MNARRPSWELENSFFANPHGLDFDAFAQGSTAARPTWRRCCARLQIDLVRANIRFSQADITVQRDRAP
ncbi:MAG: hypothetical protein ACLSVD_05805 [Eggerthellaceae bacterium]